MVQLLRGGTVSQSYSYNAYGYINADEYGVHEPFYGYNGEEHDPFTGLQYLRARYYSPQNGGFITQDSFAGILTNALSQNRYTYAENDPVNGIDPSGHAKVSRNGAKSGGSSKTNTAGRLSQSSKAPASTAAGKQQSPAKKPYTAAPTPPKPAPNYQKPTTYSSGAAKAAQSAKTASAPSSPAADVLLQTVSNPYLPLQEATGQWQLAPASVTQRVEAAKAYVRRTCDPNANRVSNQSNWDPKNLVMLSAGSSVVNPDMLSAFWEWFTAILAEKGATWATAGTFVAADGPLPIGDAIALTLILSDFLLDAESRITIEKNSNEDNKDPSDIISKFFGEQSTPANPPPNGKRPDDEESTNQPVPSMSIDDLPNNVQDAYNNYERTNWQGNYNGQTSGTRAGGKYSNSNNALPQYDSSGNPISYREFDVNNKIAGQARDAQRFIIGSDGLIYFTDSHYGDILSPLGLPSFVRIK